MWSTVRKLGWKTSCLGAALLAQQAGWLEAAPPTKKSGSVPSNNIVLASPASVTVVESLIEDAMADGVISNEERNLIISQAQRRLSAQEVAQLEARLAKLPTATVTPAAGSTQESAPAPQPMNSTEPAAANHSCCDDAGCGRLFENSYYFAAVDGWAGPIDNDNGNNFGARIGINNGFALVPDRGIGGQIGMSYGAYNFHGRDVGRERSAIEDQIFLTVGIFERCDLCAPCPKRVSWGIVYDHLVTDNLGEDGWEVGLGQFRGQIGYALDMANEVGIMASVHTHDDEVDGLSNDEDAVSALDQVSLFYHHKWYWSADTTVYVGVAEDPGSFVFGARGEVPISPCWTLFGSAQYILPSTSGGSTRPGQPSADQFSEEFWNVSVGAAYYPCGNAVSKTVCGRRWMPLLPVADNGTFAIEVGPNRI